MVLYYILMTAIIILVIIFLLLPLCFIVLLIGYGCKRIFCGINEKNDNEIIIGIAMSLIGLFTAKKILQKQTNNKVRKVLIQ